MTRECIPNFMREPIIHSECGKVRGPNWLKWLAHLVDQPGVAGLEIGTFQGDSAVFMLDNIFTHETSTYTCIDPFTGSEDHHVMGVDCTQNERIAREKLARFGDRCRIVRDYSYNALPRRLAKRTQLDAIYVDGAHDAMNCLRDAVLSFDLLVPGGVMIFDDRLWDVIKGELNRPKMAIDAFTAIYANQITILQPVGWQLALQKVA